MYFENKQPTGLTEAQSGKTTFAAHSIGFASLLAKAKPHLVGNDATLSPTHCGDKEIFKKSYSIVTRLRKSQKMTGQTEFFTTYSHLGTTRLGVTNLKMSPRRSLTRR